MEEIIPPLPKHVSDCLETARFSVIATADKSLQPHSSLMNFTYIKELKITDYNAEIERYKNKDGYDFSLLYKLTNLHDVIIVASRTNTLKWKNLEENPKCSVLVHDFGQKRETATPSKINNCAVTLSCTAILLNECAGTNDAKSEHEQCDEESLLSKIERDISSRLRDLHLNNNLDNKQFIVGTGIEVAILTIQMARVCNTKDQVKNWSRDQINIDKNYAHKR